MIYVRALLTLVCLITALIIMMSGCEAKVQIESMVPADSTEIKWISRQVYRVVDTEQNVVCYVFKRYQRGAISCLQK